MGQDFFNYIPNNTAVLKMSSVGLSHIDWNVISNARDTLAHLDLSGNPALLNPFPVYDYDCTGGCSFTGTSDVACGYSYTKDKSTKDQNKLVEEMDQFLLENGTINQEAINRALSITYDQNERIYERFDCSKSETECASACDRHQDCGSYVFKPTGDSGYCELWSRTKTSELSADCHKSLKIASSQLANSTTTTTSSTMTTSTSPTFEARNETTTSTTVTTITQPLVMMKSFCEMEMYSNSQFCIKPEGGGADLATFPRLKTLTLKGSVSKYGHLKADSIQKLVAVNASGLEALDLSDSTCGPTSAVVGVEKVELNLTGFNLLTGLAWQKNNFCPPGFHPITPLPSEELDVQCARCKIGTEKLFAGGSDVESCFQCCDSVGTADINKNQQIELSEAEKTIFQWMKRLNLAPANFSRNKLKDKAKKRWETKLKAADFTGGCPALTELDNADFNAADNTPAKDDFYDEFWQLNKTYLATQIYNTIKQYKQYDSSNVITSTTTTVTTATTTSPNLTSTVADMADDGGLSTYDLAQCTAALSELFNGKPSGKPSFLADFISIRMKQDVLTDAQSYVGVAPECRVDFKSVFNYTVKVTRLDAINLCKDLHQLCPEETYDPDSDPTTQCETSTFELGYVNSSGLQRKRLDLAENKTINTSPNPREGQALAIAGSDTVPTVCAQGKLYTFEGIDLDSIDATKTKGSTNAKDTLKYEIETCHSNYSALSKDGTPPRCNPAQKDNGSELQGKHNWLIDSESGYFQGRTKELGYYTIDFYARDKSGPRYKMETMHLQVKEACLGGIFLYDDAGNYIGCDCSDSGYEGKLCEGAVPKSPTSTIIIVVLVVLLLAVVAFLHYKRIKRLQEKMAPTEFADVFAQMVESGDVEDKDAWEAKRTAPQVRDAVACVFCNISGIKIPPVHCLRPFLMVFFFRCFGLSVFLIHTGNCTEEAKPCRGTWRRYVPFG